MTGHVITELEQNVLDAARKLGDQQRREIHFLRRIEAVGAKIEALAIVLAEAELELAQADLAYSTAKIRVLEAERKKNELEQLADEAFPACEAARRHLWTVASSNNEELILKAAQDYGEKSGKCWEISQGQVHGQITQEHTDATFALTAAGEARKLAVQKRGKAKADYAAAEDERAQLHRSRSELNGTQGFNLEVALADTAADLTGTRSKQYAYSYTHTKDLPIVLPEEAEDGLKR